MSFRWRVLSIISLLWFLGTTGIIGILWVWAPSTCFSGTVLVAVLWFWSTCTWDDVTLAEQQSFGKGNGGSTVSCQPGLSSGQMGPAACEWKHETAQHCRGCSTAAATTLPSNRKSRVVTDLKHAAWTSSWPCLHLIQILFCFLSVLYLMKNVEIGYRAQNILTEISWGMEKQTLSNSWTHWFFLPLGMNNSLVGGFAELEATVPGRESLHNPLHFPLRHAQISSSCCQQRMYTQYKAKLVISDAD